MKEGQGVVLLLGRFSFIFHSLVFKTFFFRFIFTFIHVALVFFWFHPPPPFLHTSIPIPSRLPKITHHTSLPFYSLPISP